MVFDSSSVLIRLSLHSGVGPVLINHLCSVLKTEAQWQELQSLPASQSARQCSITIRQARLVRDALGDERAWDQHAQWVAQTGTHLITLCDKRYPERLRATVVPPPVIWVQGSPCLDAPLSCSLVGARAATPYAYRVIDRVVPALVQAGITTISGGALGVDGRVHQQTIKVHGQTIVVAGCGLAHTYPPQHTQLFEEIRGTGGSIISCFSPKVAPSKGTFPTRNRIIAGLSNVCVVVQAAARSGALITSEYALQENRQVAAVPGPIDDERFAGSNRLLAHGALVVTGADAIIRECGGIPGQARDDNLGVRDDDSKRVDCHSELDTSSPKGLRRTENQYPAELQRSLGSGSTRLGLHLNVSKEERALLDELDRPQTFDDLLAAGHTDQSVLQDLLYQLQVRGVITQNYAGFWERCE